MKGTDRIVGKVHTMSKSKKNNRVTSTHRNAVKAFCQLQYARVKANRLHRIAQLGSLYPDTPNNRRAQQRVATALAETREQIAALKG